MRPQFTLILPLCTSLMSIGASGAVVTSWTGGTVQTFPVLEYYGPGPISFGPGITWSSTNANTQGGSSFGLTFNYSFLGNGYWSFFDMAGLNDKSHLAKYVDQRQAQDAANATINCELAALKRMLSVSPRDIARATERLQASQIAYTDERLRH